MTHRLSGPRRAGIVLLALTLATGAAACGDNPLDPSTYGVEVIDLRVGTGSEVRLGRGVTVHYTLWLYDSGQPENKGQQLQTTAGGQPYSTIIGYCYVIPGWEVGIPGMKVGGLRRLVVPPEQAYGSAGSGAIPPNATLVFEVELLGIY